jgi:hypothetical protein
MWIRNASSYPAGLSLLRGVVEPTIGENTSMSSTFTEAEREVIILKLAWELIDEMVNYEIFAKPPSITDGTLVFNSATHQRLFNVLLVDFLSQPRGEWPFGLPKPPHGSSASERSVLFPLLRICDAPQLEPSGGCALRPPVEAFMNWLEMECRIEKVWLPSISVETTIKVKRVSFIKICGNIAKHSFARLGQNVGEICEILKTSGTTISQEQGYLVLPEFYEWFHRNVFSYHSSAIAEFLNNIRWGIYDYLRSELTRSFTKDDPILMKYPPDCNAEVARTMYWDLMNAVRSEPYMPRFKITQYLKMRY